MFWESFGVRLFRLVGRVVSRCVVSCECFDDGIDGGFEEHGWLAPGLSLSREGGRCLVSRYSVGRWECDAGFL